VLLTPKKDDDLNLLLDTIGEGGQCLVFVSSRRSAEAYAKRAAAVLKKSSPALDELSNRIARADTTASGKTLASAVKSGAAFHHAGLPSEARKAVEDGFRNGDILVISATPTLAAGLNLPARRVIIRDYQRYERGSGMNPIPVLEYHQMAGRAGRPRLDPYGEAVLIAKEKQDVDRLFEEFIDAPAEDISSQCQRENELRSHLLALITSGFAETRDEVRGFMEKSFYASQKSVHRRLDKNVERALSYLEESGMIEFEGEGVHGTRFGALSSRLYLDPESAMMIKDGLKGCSEFTAFGMLHLLCMTPDMFRFYLKASDETFIDKILTDRGGELMMEDISEEFFAAIKTALVAEEWTDEIGEDSICERFGVGAGDIHAVVENLKWLMHAAARICHEFTPSFDVKMQDLELRVTHGVKEELIPLISLKGIGRVRARRLFNRGITSPKDILAADENDLIAILGAVTAKNVQKEAGRKSGRKSQPEMEEKEIAVEPAEKKPQATLFDFGE
jgi:helicase